MTKINNFHRSAHKDCNVYALAPAGIKGKIVLISRSLERMQLQYIKLKQKIKEMTPESINSATELTERTVYV